MKRRQRILVAPLNWGWGHATRCIPLIRELEARNCDVVIASDGSALTLLKQQFPQLKTFEIAAYNPVYTVNGSMPVKMALQLPKFLSAIQKENAQTEQLVRQEAIDVIISDNRYGCYNKKVKSIFITHQLNILLPEGWGWAAEALNYFNHRQIGRFNECWIPAPDASYFSSLASAKTNVPIKYIGFLSRFEKKIVSVKYDITVICSGPEPQRQIFEDILRQQLIPAQMRSLIIKGVMVTGNKELGNNSHIEEVACMNAEEINTAIAQSNLIVSRSGYSTIMDLAKLDKKAIFIPTPGQTEQEYLAAELMSQNVAFYMKQSEFNLQQALKESATFTGFSNFGQNESLLKSAVDTIV